jgi:hypothetical protein
MIHQNRNRLPTRNENGKAKDTHIDNLLQQTFKDDLPMETEDAMKTQLDRFQTKMEQVDRDKTRIESRAFRGVFPFKRIQWTHFLLKKEVFVVVSLLMIVLGGYIQSSGSSNKLLENLSIIGTSVVVSSQMSRAQSMECLIQLSREKEKPLKYSILWLSPNLLKIQVKDSDNTSLKTIWLSEGDIVIADFVNDMLYKKKHTAQFSDPVLQPILGYLVPTELAERMYGEWQLKQYQQQLECGRGIFTVGLPNERANLEVTVDLCTYLPVSIKKILPAEEHSEETLIFDVQYRWDVPLSPELMSPQWTKGDSKA